MPKAVLIMSGADMRLKAHQWIEQAPVNSRVTFEGPKRSLDQNSLFWAACTDIATQVCWHGQKLTPDDWKTILVASLKRELRMVPNLDNDGFVSLGHSSSALSKDEFSQLIELALAFGAREGVSFHLPKEGRE